ncbi:hypothetical protein OC845_006831, partial [Tilletia horrida]
KVPELTGRADFIHWRTMLLGMFVPYLGGRYWHLLEKDPSTGVEAYRYIFGTPSLVGDDVRLTSPEEAMMERSSDLVAIHGLILQTLSPAIVSGLDEATTAGAFDGIKLWDALVAKYGGKDYGTLRAAEDAIRAFKLNGRTVAQAAQGLQSLFTEVYLASGGEQVKEHDKIAALLTVFNVPPYQALRATIHENWQNGHPYTFDTIVSRLTGEESLHRLAVVSEGPAPSAAAALHVHTANDIRASAHAQNNTRGDRQSGQSGRRQGPQGGKSLSECWWCTKPNHRMNSCRRRINGEDPHPSSRVAADRRGVSRGPTIPAMNGPHTTQAHLAALERSLAHATALLTATALQHGSGHAYNTIRGQASPAALRLAPAGPTTSAQGHGPAQANYNETGIPFLQ